MRIAHISDTHITRGGAFVPEAFERAVDFINTEDCDFVVHTGDVTDTGLKEDYQLAKQLLRTIEKPKVVVMGNHDARNVGYELFRYYVGAPNGTMTGDDYAVIYVDSTVPDLNDGRVGRFKYEWLKGQLQEFSDKAVKIVALHHHVIPVPHTGRERNVLYNAGDLLGLFLRYDVRLVLCGHRHYPNVYRVEDLVVANAGCVSCSKTRVGDANSFNLIDIDDEQVTVRTRRCDAEDRVVSYPAASRSIFLPTDHRRARIIQISGTNITSLREFDDAKFTKAVRKINELEPDVVVHCGGVVAEGTHEDYTLANRRMAEIEAQQLYAPGPRDINFLGYHLFPRRFGDRQEAEVAGVRFKALNSVQYDSMTGIVGRTELMRLKQDFGPANAHLRCLFLHHNVLPIPHIREQGLLEDCGDVLKRVCDLGIDLLLTGHSSHPFAARIEGTIIVNSNSLSSRRQRSVFGNSFNLIDIYDEFICVSEVSSRWGSRRFLGIWRHGNRGGAPEGGDGSEGNEADDDAGDNADAPTGDDEGDDADGEATNAEGEGA